MNQMENLVLLFILQYQKIKHMEHTPEYFIENIWNSIKATENALVNGGNIEMAVLSRKAQDFCAFLALMPAAKAKTYEPELLKIIDKLTAIKNDLESQKNGLEDKIYSINRQHMALNAYNKARSYQTSNDEGNK